MLHTFKILLSPYTKEIAHNIRHIHMSHVCIAVTLAMHAGDDVITSSKNLTLLLNMPIPIVNESLRQLRPVSLGVEVMQDVIAIIEGLLVVRAVNAVVGAREWIPWVLDVNKDMLAPAIDRVSLFAEYAMREGQRPSLDLKISVSVIIFHVQIQVYIYIYLSKESTCSAQRMNAIIAATMRCFTHQLPNMSAREVMTKGMISSHRAATKLAQAVRLTKARYNASLARHSSSKSKRPFL